MKENPAKAGSGKVLKRPQAPEHGTARSQKPGPGKQEIGGPGGPEPTRYGDWQHKGIASDF